MASDLNPAICPLCKKHCAQSKGFRTAEAIYSTLILPFALITAFSQKAWWPIVLFFLVWVVYGIAKFLYLPMVAINESAVQRKYYFMLGALLVFLVWALVDAL
jgi:hypothetical protein